MWCVFFDILLSFSYGPMAVAHRHTSSQWQVVMPKGRRKRWETQIVAGPAGPLAMVAMVPMAKARERGCSVGDLRDFGPPCFMVAVAMGGQGPKPHQNSALDDWMGPWKPQIWMSHQFLVVLMSLMSLMPVMLQVTLTNLKQAASLNGSCAPQTCGLAMFRHCSRAEAWGSGALWC